MKKTKSINIENMKAKNMNPKIYLAICIFLMMMICIPGIASAQQMQVLGEWDFGPTFDVVANDNYLYLASGKQVRIYDISTYDKLLNITWQNEPDYGTLNNFPEPDNILHTGSSVKGLSIDGNYLYIATDKYLVIADISNPASSDIVSQLEVNCRDVVIKGNYAYITSGGIKVIDISDKTNPTIITHLSLAGYNKPWRMDIFGNYLYVALETDHRLDIINISDPTNPQVVGSYANGAGTTTSYSSVAVKDNYVYVVEYHNGVRVIDVSDPTNPVEVDNIIGANNPNANDIKIMGDYAYISTRYEGFIIVNISDPTNIGITKRVTVLPGYEEGIFVFQLPYGNFTFLSANTYGLGIVDTTDISNPQIMDRLLTPAGGDSIVMQGSYAYIGGHNEGVWIIDVSDSANPIETAFIKSGGRNKGLEIQGDYLYITGCWVGLSIANITDPLNPELVVYHYGTSITGNLIAVEDYLYSCSGVYDNGNIKIYDILDKANPSLIYDDTPLGYGAEVYTRYGDNYLICGGGQNGLFIIDISDRVNPVVVGNYNINMYGGDAKVLGDVIYAAASDNNLYSLDISDVTNPVLLDSISAIGNRMVIYGTTAYVLPRYASWGGLKAVDISDPTNLAIVDTLEDVGGNHYCAGFDEANGLLYTASGYIISPLGSVPLTISLVTTGSITEDSAIISWHTNKDADSLVKYSNISGSYDKQEYNSTLLQSHNILLTQLEPNTTYYFVVNSTDVEGNTTESSEESFTTTVPDITPPVITIISPENNSEIIGGTSSTTIEIETNENAWCQYSTSDFSYGEGTDFTTGQGTTEHSFVLNLKDGESYTYYYRCIDSVGNKNTISTIHTFTTATKWWDYFDDESKIGIYGGIVLSNAEATLALLEHEESLDKDASIYSISPETNYGSRLEVGTDRWRGLVEFTMPDSAGDIESIKLYLYKYDTVYESYNHTINLHKLTGSFAENEVTWNSRSSSELWTNPGVEGDYDSTVIDHLDCSGDTPEWHVWTIKGADADNPLNSLTWGNTVAFILKQSVANNRRDVYNTREASSNQPYIEIIASGTHLNSGSLTSTPITPTSLSSWDKFNTNHSTPAGTSISYSILDAQNDATLCSGLTGNNDDISGCLIGVGSIKLKAELTTTNSSATPVLYDWEVSWIAGEVSTGAISGTVTSGTVPIQGATVSDGARSDTTASDGTYTLSNVPAGTYTVTCAATGYENGSKSNIAVTEGATTTVDFQLTLSDTTPPTISNIQSSNITTTSSTITWTTDENSTSQIEYGLTSSYGSQTTKDETLVISHSVNLTNLSSNTTYHYRIISEDQLGNSSNSTDQTFKTNQSAVPDSTSPAAITDLESDSITQTSADLEWTSPGDDGNTGTALAYDIRYSLSNITESNWNSAIQISGEPIPQSAGTEQSIYIAVGLSPSTTYYFAIKTSDEVPNVSDISNILSFTTLAESSSPPGGGGGSVSDTTPPSKPSNFKATGADNQITLKWNNPTDPDFVRVKLLRKETSSPSSHNDSTAETIYEGTNQEYTDIELNNDTTYYYSIFAYDKKPNYSDILTISAKPIEGKTSIPNGNGKQTYPEGTLLKIPESFKIYIIINQKKKWIPTPEVFETLGYQWTNITEINKTELNNIPNYEDNLIRAINDYKVYLVVSGIKRHIPNPEIFLNYGFEWNDVKDVNQETINQYSQNLLIKESKQEKVYYLCPERKIRRWLRSPDIFNSYNNSWEDIQVISKYEMEHYRESNLIKLIGDDKVYLIENNTKRWIKSSEEFNRLGLDWEMVMEVNGVEMR